MLISEDYNVGWDNEIRINALIELNILMSNIYARHELDVNLSRNFALERELQHARALDREKYKGLNSENTTMPNTEGFRSWRKFGLKDSFSGAKPIASHVAELQMKNC